MGNIQPHGNGVQMRICLPFVLLALAGCATKSVDHMAVVLPVVGIEHTAPAKGKDQQYVLCAICPVPTPKTLALPDEDVEAPVESQLPSFTYTPAPAALPVAEEPQNAASEQPSVKQVDVQQAELVPEQQDGAPIQSAPEELPTKFVVLFDLDSARLSGEGRKSMEQVIASLNSRSKGEISAVEVHGYTDDIGSFKYNKRLALRRAKSVVSELSKRLQLDAPVTAKADGECCFVSSNMDEASRKPNRRVEVVLILKHRE